MPTLTFLELAFVLVAFLFQIVLIAHFAARRWAFETAIRYGPVVYALGLPAAALSLVMLASGQPWYLWLAGFLYLIWATFGYYVEYIRRIAWRAPIVWPVFIPYVALYLATVMFYWWPLALLWKPLWIVYGALFVLATVLNVTSHHGPDERRRPSVS